MSTPNLAEPLAFTVKGVSFKMLPIPAGTFLLGSPEGEVGREAGELQHPVKISKPFYMGETLVGQDLWRAVMGKNPSEFKGVGKPVDHVSFTDAQAFCSKLSLLLAGNAFGLPTEAQWEYACRAGTTTAFSFGRDLSLSMANFRGKSEYEGSKATPYLGTTSKAGTYAANAWGIFDLHGNLREWCADWFAPYGEGKSVRDPLGPPAGENRVLRGGAWCDTFMNCRAASRYWLEPAARFNRVGIRLVLPVTVVGKVLKVTSKVGKGVKA